MAVNRGSHKSASEFRDFVDGDMADMVKRRYWVVLPYHLVRNLPNLRISPLGVVPQRERRPRLIVDYSFSNVNQETNPHSKREAMQFGRALERLLRAILGADPQHGPIYLLKIDLADGFYRVWLNPADIPQLGVVLPRKAHEPINVAFPLAMPMGWTESPPWFSATTETVVDLANKWLTTWDPPQHPMEVIASTPAPRLGGPGMILTAPPPDLHKPVHVTNVINTTIPTHVNQPITFPKRLRIRKEKLAHVDVDVDDELLAAKGSKARLNRI
jgi:hypothetical protein